MEQIRDLSDERLSYYCIYCGKAPDSREHVPSKVFLDEPYPTNLPVVPSCIECNNKFSKDEVYVACLLECVLRGSADIDKLNRKKIQRILTEKKKLQQKLKESLVEDNGKIFFKFEKERIVNVLLKLAKGHAKFENSEIQFEKPAYFFWKPLVLMNNIELDRFYSEEEIDLLPEVGSRALQRLISEGKLNWINVQEGRYRYYFSPFPIRVKIVISEYLAAEIIWSD